MDSPELLAAGDQFSTPRRELQLQGPRPVPLRVGKDSHRIKKHPPARLPAPASKLQQPVVIYAISPKVIHADESNFMSIVQLLTGPFAGGGGGDVSPAARLASIEKTSPPESVAGAVGKDEMGLMLEGLGMGTEPGILSPASLPPVPATMFSAVVDYNTTSLWYDMSVVVSPCWNWSSFMASPSALLSTRIVSSPTLSMDVCSHF